MIHYPDFSSQTSGLVLAGSRLNPIVEDGEPIFKGHTYCKQISTDAEKQIVDTTSTLVSINSDSAVAPDGDDSSVATTYEQDKPNKLLTTNGVDL